MTCLYQLYTEGRTRESTEFARCRLCLHFEELLPLGKPGPKDVASRVDVGVVGVTTRPTPEHGTVAVSSVNAVALGTPLRSVTGIDSDQLPTSIFRFVDEHPLENSPSRVEDGTVQRRLGRGAVGVVASLVIRTRRRTARHIYDPEVFDNDRVISIHQFSRQLVKE